VIGFKKSQGIFILYISTSDSGSPVGVPGKKRRNWPGSGSFLSASPQLGSLVLFD
jgi:hypothetical protein